MDCEICGRSDAGFVSLIEGAKMRTCAACAHMGRIISYPPRPGATSPSYGANTGSGSSLSFAPKSKVEYDFVDDFGMLIRNARMKSHLPLSVLAEKLNEKESFLERVEHGATRPSEALARKLEKELNIKLLEEVSSETSAAIAAGGKKEVTLGDLIEIERKKKK